MSTKIKLIISGDEAFEPYISCTTTTVTILSGKCRSHDGLSGLISLYNVISMLIIVLSISECVQVLNSRICDLVWEKGPSAEMVVYDTSMMRKSKIFCRKLQPVVSKYCICTDTNTKRKTVHYMFLSILYHFSEFAMP